MTEWHSAAIDAAANGLSQYSEELNVDREIPEVARLLKEARRSSDQFFFSQALVRLDEHQLDANTWRLDSLGTGYTALRSR